MPGPIPLNDFVGRRFGDVAALHRLCLSSSRVLRISRHMLNPPRFNHPLYKVTGAIGDVTRGPFVGLENGNQSVSMIAWTTKDFWCGQIGIPHAVGPAITTAGILDGRAHIASDGGPARSDRVLFRVILSVHLKAQANLFLIGNTSNPVGLRLGTG